MQSASAGIKFIWAISCIGSPTYYWIPIVVKPSDGYMMPPGWEYSCTSEILENIFRGVMGRICKYIFIG